MNISVDYSIKADLFSALFSQTMCNLYAIDHAPAAQKDLDYNSDEVNKNIFFIYIYITIKEYFTCFIKKILLKINIRQKMLKYLFLKKTEGVIVDNTIIPNLHKTIYCLFSRIRGIEPTFRSQTLARLFKEYQLDLVLQHSGSKYGAQAALNCIRHNRPAHLSHRVCFTNSTQYLGLR